MYTMHIMYTQHTLARRFRVVDGIGAKRYMTHLPHHAACWVCTH